jgi:hypothetical protein
VTQTQQRIRQFHYGMKGLDRRQTHPLHPIQTAIVVEPRLLQE